MHADIIKRLEGLTAPDREVDADIYIALHIPAERVGKIDRLGGCVGWWPKDGPYETAIDVPCYTASLDAAVALVERVLPGQEWSAGSRDSSGNAWGKVRVAPLESIQDSGSSPSIALLLALFHALDARGQESER